MSGNSASRPSQTACVPNVMATMLMITATVKAIDSQRWTCRINLFQFMRYSLQQSAAAASVRAGQNLVQFFEELLPSGMRAAIGLALIGAESGLLHAQARSRRRRRQRERHHAF